MAALTHCSFARRFAFLSFSLLLWLAIPKPAAAQSSEPQQKPPAASTPSAPPAGQSATAAPTASSNDQTELSSRDTPATFKVRVNLVQVRIVVRDVRGNVVENLHREDFQLFDNNKAQAISAFSMETPASHAVAAVTPAAPGDPEAAEAAAKISASLPQRFVALLFDDEHFSLQDASFVRNSVDRFFTALTPSDRVAVFTTSGQLKQEFTSDRELLRKTLLGIVPRPAEAGEDHACPDISYYQADLIEVKNDDQALAVAAAEALQCAFNGDQRFTAQAQALAQSQAIRALNAGDSQAEFTYRRFEEAIRRLSTMPGQRVMIFVSPGFMMSSVFPGSFDLIDRATRANIVINTLDARGLYTPDVVGDIADPPQDPPRVAGYKATYRIETQTVQSEILGDLAYGTGGTFFHNRNDLDEGFREAGVAPAVSYLLAFSPQNLKLDGRFHQLKVTLTGKQKFSIQARRGYYAPRTVADPNEQAKQEIEEALFSQDEMRDLALEIQTQFFKTDAADARLAVLSHLDLKELRFRKADGRNNDNLTVATAIFDENGKFVTGGEKVVEMRLKDNTVDRLGRSGLTLKSSFDVKPGTYLVRQVVRDAEGSQMAARNGAVVIPY